MRGAKGWRSGGDASVFEFDEHEQETENVADAGVDVRQEASKNCRTDELMATQIEPLR